eukprot:4229619-Amphidinium_carterae.1
MKPKRPTRAVPISQHERDAKRLEDSLQGKGKKQKKGATSEIPKTPSKPILSPRLQLKKKNFNKGTIQRPDSYYEKRIRQEMMQASYIKYHPTSG